ncbi:MAG: hypothetical protein HY926_10625 [Elusimicrobia bacterium]|nr:hypothetical protein [Elusimicrobiota bacterium]
MKKHFWLILAVLSLLGMLIMPGTAHSAPVTVPTALPHISSSRLILPNYPIPQVTIRQPLIQLPMPKLQPSLIPVSLPSVAAVTPIVLAPAVMSEAPAVAVPVSAIPSSRIEGISAGRKARKGAGGILSRLGNEKGERKLAALFDGAQQKEEPAAVPVGPTQGAPADSYEDNSLTLPESDLAEEIGLGY